jgi:hypothetical protein
MRRLRQRRSTETGTKDDNEEKGPTT